MSKTRGILTFSLATTILNCAIAPAKGAEPSHQANAIALYQKQDYKGAATLFERAAGENASATPTYYLALCEIQLRNQSRAVQLFQKICHDWPTSPEAVHATTYLKNLEIAGGQSVGAGKTVLFPPKSGDTKNDTGIETKENAKFSIAHVSKAEWEALPSKTRILIHREHGHLMIDAKVNGQWGKFAFDTGATRCGIGLFDYPNMFTKAQLEGAKRIAINRPQGVVVGWDLVADVTVQDITRKVGFTVLPEKNVCVIGQNFFKEYNCQIDDFYIRLTKAPYQGESSGIALVIPGPATGAAANPSLAIPNKAPLAVVSTTKPGEASTAAGGIVSNTTRNSINNSMVISDLKNTPTKPALDKYTISFERLQDTMLIDIVVNGIPVKAIFDTGCAPDGIVCHPDFAEKVRMQPMSRRADRIQIGSIIRMDVPVYYAGGLQYPLVGPKIFNRPYTIDPVNKLIKFDY
jgi:hypothetical protein